mmetsp:Transcript_14014/g.19690  ORF Transcript_14014/g.19690 Transcript_14014/m.19690 type:complete len:218 (-) Transcript_14014:648-1301(-)
MLVSSSLVCTNRRRLERSVSFGLGVDTDRGSHGSVVPPLNDAADFAPPTPVITLFGVGITPKRGSRSSEGPVQVVSKAPGVVAAAVDNAKASGVFKAGSRCCPSSSSSSSAVVEGSLFGVVPITSSELSSDVILFRDEFIKSRKDESILCIAPINMFIVAFPLCSREDPGSFPLFESPLLVVVEDAGRIGVNPSLAYSRCIILCKVSLNDDTSKKGS